jgi:hypothetical protein
MNKILAHLQSLFLNKNRSYLGIEKAKKVRMGRVITNPSLTADKQTPAVYPCHPLPNVREFKVKLLSE